MAKWGGRRAQALTRYVLDRDGFRCRMPRPDGEPCGRPATTADHVVPIARGGALWDPANLRAACRPCNVAAGARLGNERRREIATPTLPPSRLW